MQKIKLVLSYDGSRFDGFAVQKGKANTVSNRLYKAFKSIGIYEKFNAAGRTDKGVHATFQVIDINIPNFWLEKLSLLKKELNSKIFPDILIKRVEVVDANFHARYSAKKRAYRYIISFENQDPYRARYVTFLKKRVDKVLIKDAVKLFEGVHDFEYFKKSKGGTTNYVRQIYKANYYEYKNYGVFYFEANGFLRSQIRLMVDFLLKIDKKLLSMDDLKKQLEKKEIFSRTLAEPYGLYLSKVIF